MRRTLKALTALTAGLALLVLTTAPSPAQTAVTATGIPAINTTPPTSLNIGPRTDPNCGTTVDIVMDDHNPTSTSTGHVALTIRTPLSSGGSTYYVQLVYSSSALTLTHLTTSDYDAAISPFTIDNAMAYVSSGPGSCTDPATGPVTRCANMDVAFTSGLDGTFDGTISSTPPHTLSSGSTATFAGVGNIAAAGCWPPFSAWHGKSLTFFPTVGTLFSPLIATF